MRLAGGLALAFAAASALAGSNLAIAAGVAVVIAFLATLIPESPDDYPGYEVNRVVLSQLIVGLPLIAVYASTFGAYVVPQYPKIASAGLVLLVALLTSDWRMDRIRPLRTIVLAALAVGAVVLMTASFNESPEDIREGQSQPWWGVALAAIALVLMLVPTPGSSRRSRLGRFALALPIAAVIYVGTVYQLGTELAPTFLKDLLIAAELDPLGAALVALIGAATVTAAIDTWSDAETELDTLTGGWWPVLAGILATAAMAAFVPPVLLMTVAGAGVIVNAAIWWHIGYVYIKYSS